MFAATGSTITAAISPGNRGNAASRAATSLYGTTVVSAASSSGTPGLPAIPSVARPEPAATRKASPCPWYPPSVLTMRFRPVAARASRAALMVASVPELTKRTIVDRRHHPARPSRPDGPRAPSGAPYEVPRRVARAIARCTKAGPWPNRCGP